MRIALIGASGNVGSRLAAEFVARGHTVTGIVRYPENATPSERLCIVKGDARDATALAALIAGHDVVVSSARHLDSDARSTIDAVKTARVPRLVVVGGAGSLEVAPGKKLLDTLEFPAAYKPEAVAGAAFLDLLRAEPELDWTYVSPSAEFVAGQRTQRFRLGGNELLTDARGRSWISMEDYALALADELEKPAHRRQRFTVGY
ncbi:MAG TPA: NAD(P)-dependent oxidoreductase [Povalibacter sp.]|uniref:NAD(P)-dependent oxidoreductase n=1 Tax=Povalibacter sp. TaxID=1962978 RepID=UPI002BA9DB3D|nr:NAD(P)-dependent oxidoreductase [Povalibacter sp.]HMN43507.1 NAD(P)-dependent oxidoreductase [Povalibacter sp.]